MKAREFSAAQILQGAMPGDVMQSKWPQRFRKTGLDRPVLLQRVEVMGGHAAIRNPLQSPDSGFDAPKPGKTGPVLGVSAPRINRSNVDFPMPFLPTRPDLWAEKARLSPSKSAVPFGRVKLI